MKAAPNKIYMTPSFGEPDNVLLASFSKSHLNFHRDVEYIRSDVFIEKALKFIKTNVDRIVNNQHGVCMGCMDWEFRNYMEGE